MRGFRIPRCARCWLEQKRCICGLLRPIDNTVPVSIFIPWSESRRPSNTGRLAYLLLTRCELHLRGSPLPRSEPERLVSPGSRALVLFPDADAEELTPEHAADERGRTLLIVPDGTWRQARKMLSHEPSLVGLKRVRLPRGTASRYRLRQAKAPGQLCTFEAVARALSILEGPALLTEMMVSFEAMVERSLKTRGGLVARSDFQDAP